MKNLFSRLFGAFSKQPKQDIYVVLDFETSGLSARDNEIIEIGAAKYADGKEIDCLSTFVKPINGIREDASKITGITYHDVKNAPILSDVIPDLLHFLDNYPIVAHNARFDTRFLMVALARMGLTMSNEVYDTLDMARQAFPGRDSYKLADLKEGLKLGNYQSHRALSDVRTTAELFMLCRHKLPKYAPQPIASVCGIIRDEDLTPQHQYSHIKACDITPSASAACSTECALYGKTVVFTGNFTRPLADLMQAAADAGANLWDRVTLKTDYLVEGEQDPDVVGPDGMSGKQIKARKYNEEGKANIRIISESEFLHLIG